MIRLLQNILILATILLSTSALVIAQSEQQIKDSRAPQEILDSYGGFKHAVIHMTRDEWEIVRAWEGFDENEYLAALKVFKDSYADERAKRKERD